MKARHEIPSRQLHGEFVAMGNCSYSYEEIVATVQAAVAINAELEAAEAAAWAKFEEATDGVDFLFMSDDQRKLMGKLTDLLNECHAIDAEMASKGRELIPCGRIQKSIKTVRKHIWRINEFVGEISI